MKMMHMTGFVGGWCGHRLVTRKAPGICSKARTSSPGRSVTVCLDVDRRMVSAGALASLLLATEISPALSEESTSEEVLPVLDNARALTSGEVARLNRDLKQFEAEKGFKIRVLVQKRTGKLTEPKTIWTLDESSVVVLVDPAGGNILDFRVGRNVRELLTSGFWTELQNRYGNKFYVADNGEDRVILTTVDTIKQCIVKGGCRQVPGFSRDQWKLTAVVTGVAGVIAGLAPRQGGKKQFDPLWLFIFSPLWGFIFITFGVGPIVTREGWLSADLAANCGIFLSVAVASYFASARVFPPREELE